MIRKLGARYELQEQVGGGGMAVVYRALDTVLGRTVAVKMLRPQFSGDDEFVTRFRQEAQSAARLSHPNIVSLYDVGMTDNEYYIVMEYVDGPTLKDVIRDRAPLPIPEVVNIATQICDALEHAHNRNIIHRDVKPHNILMAKSGLVKVTDFGIARAVSGNTITHQSATTVLGSVHYFSPEQARGGTADVKSDIYSLGVVMYEMLTKQLPFSGDSPVSVALKHLRDRVVEPREINPEIPQSVENIILRCLVKSPDLRYTDMRAVKADLQDALANPNVPKFVMPSELSEETIAVPIVGQGTGPDGTWADTSEQPKKRRWWMVLVWILIAFAVLIVGAFAAYYIVMRIITVKNVDLPNVVGMTEKKAELKLEAAGFSANQIHHNYAYSSKTKGIVYNQDPAPQPVKANREIELYISRGPAKIPIPNLQSLPLDQAMLQLENAGFNQDKISEQPMASDQFDPGTVVDSEPTAGTPVTADSKIVLMVSTGPQIIVPDVTSMSLSDAENALRDAKLAVGQVYRMPAAAKDGTVFKVAPYRIGQKVPAGTPIDLYVAENVGESGGSINGITPPTGDGSNNSGSTGTNTDSSGVGNDTASTGSSDGSLPGNLPTDTHVRPVEIVVPDKDGRTLNVTIIKSDAQATMQQLYNQQINVKTTWVITLYVTPNTPGQVLVYVNGEQLRNVIVNYNDN